MTDRSLMAEVLKAWGYANPHDADTQQQDRARQAINTVLDSLRRYVAAPLSEGDDDA